MQHFIEIRPKMRLLRLLEDNRHVQLLSHSPLSVASAAMMAFTSGGCTHLTRNSSTAPSPSSLMDRAMDVRGVRRISGGVWPGNLGQEEVGGGRGGRGKVGVKLVMIMIFNDE